MGQRTVHLPTSSFTTAISQVLQKTRKSGWIQALMDLMAHNWAEIQNPPLQDIGYKTRGKKWIYSLIQKLWDTAWDIRNYRNQKLQSQGGPTKHKS